VFRACAISRTPAAARPWCGWLSGMAARATGAPASGALHVVPPDRAVAAVARAQHGVVARDQLLALGLSRHAVAHRIAKGHLHPLHRGVYAVGHRSLSAHGRHLAAVLACGPEAVLSHRSAAVLWDLLAPQDDGPIHVTAPTHRRPPAGVQLHCSVTSQLVHRHAIAVTVPVRTLVDLAATAPREELARALEEARLQRLVTDGELQRCVRCRPGARALRDLLVDEPSLSRSEAERRLLSLLRRAGLPSPRTNVRVAGHEVDALWPHQRLVVEVDGFAFH
jgi:Transcriptional regulator, AbiEi antitoxin